jgi:polygalacturonase
MTIIHSQNVLLQDIYVNSTSNVRRKGSNTDGADTFYVNNVTFKRWTVANGDDGISLKANSTNIIIEDSTLYGGAIALGSIGQYMDVYETIENVTVRNITYLGGFAPVYAKTWTGKQKGYPPNGGGGGLGVIRNISRHRPNSYPIYTACQLTIYSCKRYHSC